MFLLTLECKQLPNIKSLSISERRTPATMSFINLFRSISNFQFPYTIEEKPIQETLLWQVFYGSRKSDSLPVTIFKANRNEKTEPLIANAVHKSKILRIPGLCRVLETFESDPQSTFIVTERATPFPWDQLNNYSRNKEALEVGILEILNTLSHLSNFVLGTLSEQSIFIDSKGQWILFGFELCADRKQMDPGIFGSHMRLYNNLNEKPTLSDDPTRVDAMQLGKLITKLLGGTAGVPKDWSTALQSLSQGRTSIQHFNKKLQSTSTWINNPLISLHQQLEEIHIKDSQGKFIVMSNLQIAYFENRSLFHHLLPQFVRGMLIPELTKVINWLISTQSGNPSVLPKIIPLLAIFLDLTIEQEYFPEDSKQLLYSSFALQDRQVRFLLLIYLPKIITRLEKKEISDKIYPRFSMGLADTDSTLRLQTLKSIPVVVSYITERQLNNELLRYLAKTQVDVDVDIRAWTIIVITKISTMLSSSSGNRANILATAFTKSLKDPDVKARLASLYGLNKTIDLFDVKTIANKILTVIAPGLLDKEPLVRSKAKALFQKYLNKLEDEAKLLQDSDASAEPQTKDINFDSYCEMDSSNVDELAKQFLSSILITTGPGFSDTDTATSGVMDDDVWANFGEKNSSTVSDDFGSFPAKVSQAQDSFDDDDVEADFDESGWGDFSFDEPQEIKSPKPVSGKPVKVQRSWNSHLSDDEPTASRSLTQAPDKKTSILNRPKVSSSILTPRSSASHSRSSTPSSLSRTAKPAARASKLQNKPVKDEFDDDAWDTAW
ncbi:hypothetical protein ZYGR_0H02530 [Zygosaccharomyces rouxii]|uniref:ZYRO0B09834p n=2 Tax=Zygosaccharomyces rouxii TaxID=4956 RepID=C5DRN3_ZYGRC|nr:uncharacterized protein ZYRO0B09834g [Zygosaccharomyces rouxii]KAH9200022.1 armadillo-type protein [Zygosaccharomyces rouxii]GAV47411.1 hypothetical protein ZYGR_0H02530 [Zygosaccharomyces rouxii]CAR26444.1 ZYRO0B09834p [Zygosaccharomyces rouxii]